MTIWLIMIALAIGTFLSRISFIQLLGYREVHPLVSRALRFVPAAMLTALVVPQILTRKNALQISFANPQIIAGLFATLVAWRTKNVFFTIMAGMVVLWAQQILLPGR